MEEHAQSEPSSPTRAGEVPMKVIKIGTGAQQRIAQACDRCRSKKIRCDGMRPSCTQCLNVGFECKTSDKLSRRAFPRGYTESLEERVRSLQAEVRDLKIQLDEKDENVETLSRMHSQADSPHPAMPIQTKSTMPTPAAQNGDDDRATENEDTIMITISRGLVEQDPSDCRSAGIVGTRALIDAFKLKLESSGKFSVDLHSRTFFTRLPSPPATPAPAMAPPPRLVSDQLVNIFFTEWAPLFPALHRPTILRAYERFIAGSEELDQKSITQLYLVFALASLGSEKPQEPKAFESQWQGSLETFITDPDLATLQCLTLATCYCLHSADHTRLLKYRALGVALAHRLGVNQSQNRFKLSAFQSEARKKVFWTLYTVDCITSAEYGLPRAFNDADVYCEFPIDTDDDCIPGKDIPPGGPTKVSGALAMFKLARIMSKILTNLYPATATVKISSRMVAEISSELDVWYRDLPSHLRLQFSQDKLWRNVISSPALILSLSYCYVRLLVSRPVACAQATSKEHASSTSLALASASKQLLQIMQLLEARNLSFSFSPKQSDLLVSCGFGLMFHAMDLDPDGMPLREYYRLVLNAIELLEHYSLPLANELRRILYTMFGSRLSSSPPAATMPAQIRSDSDSKSQEALRSTQRHLKAIAARFGSTNGNAGEDDVFKSLDSRRIIAPATSRRASAYHASGFGSPSSTHSELVPQMRPPGYRSASVTSLTNPSLESDMTARRPPNLDFMAFAAGPGMISRNTGSPMPSTVAETDVSPDEWERIISTMDNGDTTIYDTIYGGPGISPAHVDSDDPSSLPRHMLEKQVPPPRTFARPRAPMTKSSTPSLQTSPPASSRTTHPNGNGQGGLDWTMVMPPPTTKNMLGMGERSGPTITDEWGILIPELSEEAIAFANSSPGEYEAYRNARV